MRCLSRGVSFLGFLQQAAQQQQQQWIRTQQQKATEAAQAKRAEAVKAAEAARLAVQQRQQQVLSLLYFLQFEFICNSSACPQLKCSSPFTLCIFVVRHLVSQVAFNGPPGAGGQPAPSPPDLHCPKSPNARTIKWQNFPVGFASTVVKVMACDFEVA